MSDFSCISMENHSFGDHGQSNSNNIARPLAKFHPNLWGDQFLNYTPHNQDTQSQKEEEMKNLKKQVLKKLKDVVRNPKERLLLIDTIQRLGVAYHFETEIDAILQEFRDNYNDDDCYQNELHYMSLRLRLLRQHGFHVSCDVLDKFKDEHGCFKDSLTCDVQGLLSLYEAANIRVHGEKVLDEALAFTTAHLTSLAKQISCPYLAQIKHALKLPLHRRTTRMESRNYISVYEYNPSHDGTLLRFAKLDFDLLQQMHKKELSDLTRWSRSLDFSTKFPFARDRMVEAYFWILGVYYEPHFSFARIILNKLFKIISILDDIYDAYGTIKELENFTEAIERFDKSCMHQLPDYMKFVYQIILDTIQEFEQGFAKEGRSYVIHYIQQEIISSCKAYLQEAQWCHENYIPTYDEYMRNGIVSSGYFYMITASYLGMEAIATRNAFEWIHHNSKAPEASCVLARVLNDIGTHKFEQSRGHVASAIESYMLQYVVSREEAIEKLQYHVEEAWMSINEDMLQAVAIPKPLLTRILNLSRTLYDVYQIDEDGYTMAQFMQSKIEAVLIHPAIS